MFDYRSVKDFFENIPKDQVIVVYGEPASGKTTLALQATLKILLEGKKVIFIDSENGLTLSRLRQMNSNVDKFLDNLIVLRPRSLLEQEDIITKLPIKCGLVVLDSLSKYYRVELKNDSVAANNSVITQLRKLHKFVDAEIPVIVSNQVYTTIDKTVKAVGGDMIVKWSKILIKLEKNPRKFIVEKPAFKKMRFVIDDSGLFGI
jgi:DNA repair protein RadB